MAPPTLCLLKKQIWLMLAQETNNSGASESHISLGRGFYNLSTGIIQQFNLPQAYDKKCYSSRGWLLTIGQDWNVILLHPFTCLQIELPPLKTFKDWEWDSFTPNLDNVYKTFIQRFALSCSPSCTSDYTAMVIHGEMGKLAYCKAGDKAWTTIETPLSNATSPFDFYGYGASACYFDITYFKGKFYGVNCHGRIMSCDTEGDNPTEPQVVATLPSSMMLFEKIYLVESEGSLLAITREGVHVRPIYEGSEICCYGTYGFRVFEVNFESNTCEEMKNLGNNTVFVGDNSSFSVKASEVMGYKPNSIYFTDDCLESYLGMDEEENLEMTMMDMGIYRMEDGRIEPHFKGTSISYITPPLWIEGEVDHILSRL